MEHQIKDWKYIGEFKGGKFHGTGAFYWSKLNYYEGTFENGSMTGNGVYYLADGGKFDSSVGLYYPDREDASVFHEAHFDGQHLRYKEAQPARQTQGGY